MSTESIVERLVAQMAELERRTAWAEARTTVAEARIAALVEARATGADDREGGAAESGHPQRLSRKGLLQAAAGAAALAATSLAAPGRAAAADGDPIRIGQGNSGTLPTSLNGPVPNAGLLYMDNSGGGGAALLAKGADGTQGLWGHCDGPEGQGLYGLNNGGGFGVVGDSASGVALYARFGGRLRQDLRFTAGPPTAGQFTAGEQVRDANGDLYLCVAGGTPGTWRRVAAVDPAFAGGATHYLPAPIRLLDTRDNPGAPIAAGGTHTLQVVGASVPVGARGVVGNVTVVPSQAGYLTLYPTGATRPLAASSNYGPGQIVNTLAMVGLSAAGQMSIYAAGTTHVIFDAVAFVR